MQVTNLTDQHIDSSIILNRVKGRGSSILSAITSNPKIAVGVGVVAFFVLIALAAPLLTPYDPNASVVTGSLPPSAAHILGTTGLGQDMFAQLVYGARVTLLVGFCAAIGSTVLQVFFGLTSAYFGGIIDDVCSLLINVFLVLLFTSWSYGARVLRAHLVKPPCASFLLKYCLMNQHWLLLPLSAPLFTSWAPRSPWSFLGLVTHLGQAGEKYCTGHRITRR
jgi:hypothetical protein